MQRDFALAAPRCVNCPACPAVHVGAALPLILARPIFEMAPRLETLRCRLMPFLITCLLKPR